MGVSTDAYLVYGYHLGSDEGGWLLREAEGKYGELRLDWLPDPDEERDEDEDDDSGFATLAMNRLVQAAGFTETDWQVDGYFARRREAEKRLGVEFVSHCSSEYPMWILGTRLYDASRGQVVEVDPMALANHQDLDTWNEKLTQALQVLGITPLQEQPRWLLCSYWG